MLASHPAATNRLLPFGLLSLKREPDFLCPGPGTRSKLINASEEAAAPDRLLNLPPEGQTASGRFYVMPVRKIAARTAHQYDSAKVSTRNDRLSVILAIVCLIGGLVLFFHLLNLTEGPSLERGSGVRKQSHNQSTFARGCNPRWRSSSDFGSFHHSPLNKRESRAVLRIVIDVPF